MATFKPKKVLSRYYNFDVRLLRPKYEVQTRNVPDEHCFEKAFNEERQANEYVGGLFKHLEKRDKLTKKNKHKLLHKIYTLPEDIFIVMQGITKEFNTLITDLSHLKINILQKPNFKSVFVRLGMLVSTLRFYASIRYYTGVKESICETPSYLSRETVRKALERLDPYTDWCSDFFESFVGNITTFDIHSEHNYKSVLQSIWLVGVYYTLKVLFIYGRTYTSIIRSAALRNLKRIFEVPDKTDYNKVLNLSYPEKSNFQTTPTHLTEKMLKAITHKQQTIDQSLKNLLATDMYSFVRDLSIIDTFDILVLGYVWTNVPVPGRTICNELENIDDNDECVSEDSEGGSPCMKKRKRAVLSSSDEELNSDEDCNEDQIKPKTFSISKFIEFEAEVDEY